MKLSTKIVVILALAYNCMLGYLIAFTPHPFIILAFLSIDFFLIFYYMWLLIRQNLGFIKFGIENRELIRKAKEEVGSSK